MHYQLWFPGATRDAAGLLKSAGLADFVEGAMESIARIDDVAGLLVTWSGEAGYIPDRQKWITPFVGATYRIGFWTDSSCGPEDLRRSSLFDGYLNTLGDGQTWQIPKAADLPSTMRLVDRQWTKIRKPRFDGFWKRSEAWYRRFMQCDLESDTICRVENLTPSQLYHDWSDFCVEALRQNYRLTPEIASELGLLDSESLLRITMAVVDGMAIAEVLAEMRHNADVESATEQKKSGSVTSA